MKKILQMSLLACLIFSGTAFASAENQPADETAPKAGSGQEMTQDKTADSESSAPAEAGQEMKQEQLKHQHQETTQAAHSNK